MQEPDPKVRFFRALLLPGASTVRFLDALMAAAIALGDWRAIQLAM